MKRIVLLLLCMLFFIIDHSLMPFLAIKGFYPSILLIFVICYSIITDSWDALWIGIFSGLLQDIYFFNGFGINTFTNMIVCLIASKIGENIFKDKKFIPVISLFFLCFLKCIMIFVILYITGTKMDIYSSFYVSLYSMILTIFMYKKVYKLCQKNYMKKEWNF